MWLCERIRRCREELGFIVGGCLRICGCWQMFYLPCNFCVPSRFMSGILGCGDDGSERLSFLRCLKSEF